LLRSRSAAEYALKEVQYRNRPLSGVVRGIVPDSDADMDLTYSISEEKNQ
jgi:hypothetical protein